jgi:hypothetical protein
MAGAFLASLGIPIADSCAPLWTVESSHLRSRGNHTIYFCVLLRVTVRVNLGAKRGYIETMRPPPSRRRFPRLSRRINILTPVLYPCVAWRCLRMGRAMGIEATRAPRPGLENKQFGAKADPKCDGRVNFRDMWGHVGIREQAVVTDVCGRPAPLVWKLARHYTAGLYADIAQ